jgi:hypothetical protein
MAIRIRVAGIGRIYTMAPFYASVADFTKLIGLGRSTVYEMLASGDFIAVKVGARTLVDVTKAREFLAAQPPAEFNSKAA